MTVMTQIVQEHPGYYWQYDEEATTWHMMWEPIHRSYSPPRLHPDIVKYDVHVPMWFQDHMGLLIGRQGYNFIRITYETGCHYIYYRSDQNNNKIEVWGPRQNVIHATRRLKKLMFKIQNSISQT